MCVGGFKNSYKNFGAADWDKALEAATPGSAVSFDRQGFFHFAVFFGWAWPRGGEYEPIPLVCHLSGSPVNPSMASVRLEDFREIVQGCRIRVYQCNCTPGKRAEVIYRCLLKIGTKGYNPVTRNCEHFVRDMIDGERVSYQSIFTFVQLPRLIFGSAVGGTLKKMSSSSKGLISALTGHLTLGLISPEMDLLMVHVENSGQILKGVEVNASCTREFTGSNKFSLQRLYNCRTCGAADNEVCCKPCLQLCHRDCSVEAIPAEISQDVCSCRHSVHARDATPTIEMRPRGDRNAERVESRRAVYECNL